MGLDFSPRAVATARDLARDCGLHAEFVCANVYDAAGALGGRHFDIVYTGIGALNWLPDLPRWAQVVADLVRPGGLLYLVEIHPMVLAMVKDGRTLSQDVFGAAYSRWDSAAGNYAAPDAEMSNTIGYERAYSLGEVVSSVLDTGLHLEMLHEHGYTNAPWPWCVRDGDGWYRLPHGWPKFPLAYSLRARRPGS